MRSLRVRVPATTANVGSGFDCVGIALDWYDELSLEVDTADPGGSCEVTVDVSGEGAGAVPQDASHLVVATILRGLQEWGGAVPAALHLTSHNTIPHSRGLGSSAAAIVAGLTFAWGIAHPGEPMDRAEVARLAGILEGHPDNSGAAVMGGAVLGVMQGDAVEMVALEASPELSARVWVPSFEVPTSGARGVLPTDVPRSDAVAQAIAAALLPVAMASRPDLLLAATSDRLHQPYRAALMPSSFDLMTRLRSARVPAAISGAGPTVFAIGTADHLVRADAVTHDGFDAHTLGFGSGVSLDVP